jgi:hypothetical protein
MWPPLLMLDPPSAASALQYRWDRREGAAAKAAACGQPNSAWCPPAFTAPAGALMFPWESAFTGYARVRLSVRWRPGARVCVASSRREHALMMSRCKRRAGHRTASDTTAAASDTTAAASDTTAAASDMVRHGM